MKIQPKVKLTNHLTHGLNTLNIHTRKVIYPPSYIHINWKRCASHVPFNLHLIRDTFINGTFIKDEKNIFLPRENPL